MSMTIKTIGRCRGLVYGVLAAFALLVLPVGQYAGTAVPAAESGSLSGFIFAKDMKTPVSGAVVKIRNLGDQKELGSPPTDANGMFTIASIPEGRYILGVTSGREDFNFDYSVHIKAGELGKLSVALARGAAGQEPGEAASKKPGFFNTVAGRVILITAASVAVYFLFFNETSPIRD
jgi:hypothetical protein